MFRRQNWLALPLIGGLALAAADMACAADNILCVPWQGDPVKQHTVTSGGAALLKCVVKADSTATRWYQWSFGDGSGDSGVLTVSGSTKYNLGISHTYTGATGTPFTATLKVDKVDSSMSNAVSGTYLTKIEDNNLDAQINVAIDKGLWWLYNNGSYDVVNSRMSWHQWDYTNTYTSPTASAIQAFAINNHKIKGDPTKDPYVEAVKWGMNFLINAPRLAAVNIAGNAADGNHNNYFLYPISDQGSHIYEGGQVMDAIIASGVAPGDSTGRDFAAAGHNWTYGEVVQDLADMYAYGQHSPLGAWGEWQYYTGQYDNSSSQWAAIGLIPAQAAPWNVVIPPNLKSQNATWLAYSYCANGGTGYVAGGYFGYQGACGSYNDNAFNTTPSGMVMMDMDGQVGYNDPATVADERDVKWIGAEKFMADNWNTFMNTTSPSWGRNRSYGFYAVAKAMRLAVPRPVEFITNSGGTSFDWYRGDGSHKGLAQRIVELQFADGHWTGNLTNEPLTTAWMTIILKPALFAASPIACFTASPNPSFANLDITFNPSCSGHSETGKTIANLTKFEWDWNNDGVFDASSTTPTNATHQFACAVLPCAYPVKLKVTDDNDPALTATTVVTINITNPPHPPVAKSGGPYMVSMCTNDSLLLDGSASFDQDQGQHQEGCTTCPVDTITAWDWDLKAPLTFDAIDKTGAKPALTSAEIASDFTVGGNGIALRVTDNTFLAYPSSGEANLTNAAFDTVTVRSACMCDLAARVKSGKIALTWAPVAGAGSYDVYRSVTGPNTGFAKVASNVSGATYVDASAVNGTKYYYRVVANTGCGSAAVSATAGGR